ncbi:hypothetical protein BGZ82_001043 [Podila clonocystis]|nr:hypothetical protein BGZ82_001043 [Podila clonocystis]
MTAYIPTRWMDLDVIRATIELREDNTTSVEIICKWNGHDIRLLPDPLAISTDSTSQDSFHRMLVGTRLQAKGLMTIKALSKGRGVRRRPVLGLALAVTELRTPQDRDSRGGGSTSGRGEGEGSSSGSRREGERPKVGRERPGGKSSGETPKTIPSPATVEELKKLVESLPKPPKDSELKSSTRNPIPPVHILSPVPPAPTPAHRPKAFKTPSPFVAPITSWTPPFDLAENTLVDHFTFNGLGQNLILGSSLPPPHPKRGRQLLYTFDHIHSDDEQGEVRWHVVVTYRATESYDNIEVYKQAVGPERIRGRGSSSEVVFQRVTPGRAILGAFTIPDNAIREYVVDELGQRLDKHHRKIKGGPEGDWRCVFTQVMADGRRRSVHVVIQHTMTIPKEAIPGKSSAPASVQIWEEITSLRGPAAWVAMKEERPQE